MAITRVRLQRIPIIQAGTETVIVSTPAGERGLNFTDGISAEVEVEAAKPFLDAKVAVAFAPSSAPAPVSVATATPVVAPSPAPPQPGK